MDRFEYRSAFACRSRRKQSHRTTDYRTFIRKDITECIFGNHYIKEFRLLNHLHGCIVHEHIVRSHFRILRCHFLGNLSPQAWRCEHIGFIYHREVLIAFHGILETNFQNTFNLRTSVHIGIIRFVVVLILLAEIHTTGQLADTKKICTIHQFCTKRWFMEQTFESLYRTDIGKQSQFLTHSQ